MKRCPGPVRPSGLSSFTLVEVVFAIAIIAFVLISVLGLMTYASRLVQQADTNSRLADVVGQVSAQFDSQPFSVSTNLATTNASYYFTSEGLPTNSGRLLPVLRHQCRHARLDINQMMQIQMSIRWPSPKFTNTNVIVTSTLNYD